MSADQPPGTAPPKAPLKARVAAVAQGVPFRVAAAAFMLMVHVGLHVANGASRYNLPFDNAPGQRPAFNAISEPMGAHSPARWNRLLVSRWDAQHYMGTALRGFTQCPPQDMRTRSLTEVVYYCDFNFYPGYGLLGRWASLWGVIPIDYAMFAVSLAGSFAFLFLFTHRRVTEALGLGTTWLAFLLFNVSPAAFTLVTVLTEPACLGFIMAAFVALSSRRYLLAAALAGAATGLRISAAAAAVAVSVAIVVSLFVDRPVGRRALARRLAGVPLSGWGVLVMYGFYWVAYSDPLLYLRSHAASYAGFKLPPAVWFTSAMTKAAISTPGRDGFWVVAFLLLLALGYREATRGFPVITRAFLHCLTFFTLAVAISGAWPLHFLGMPRYFLLAFPIFFAMAKALRERPVVLVGWVLMCGWAYWNVQLCGHIGTLIGGCV